MRRPAVACALLLAAYVVLSLLNDQRGYLGTDTGGKVATLRVMEERGRLDPDLGYWAERWDPEGRVHPLYYTSKVGDRWVNATTLPMLYAGYPLYRLGGYRLALLLPMLGSVLGALAARALARRLSATDGWAAFWIVGLASPLTIYALDFWEHSLGVAATAWAVVVLFDLVAGRKSPWWALAAGALFGAAATLRTEALVYGFVAVAAACVVVWVGRRRLGAAVAAGVLAAAGLSVPLAANWALEAATLGSGIRGERAASTATSAAVTGEAAAGRILEAGVYAVGLHPRLDAQSVALGVALLGLLAFAVVGARRDDAGPAVLAFAGAGALYLLRFAVGPGFVPGLVAAAPLAVVGIVHGWRARDARYPVAVALAALPPIWATQFLGGAAPQWGARYILVSGLVLTAVGAATLGGLRAWSRRGFVGLAVVVTVFGLVWMSIRTHRFGEAAQALNDRAEPVLVSRVTHLVREGGSFYGSRRWLTAETDDDQRYAIEVLSAAGVRRFGLVTRGLEAAEPPVLEGWRAVGSDRIPLLNGIEFDVTTYEAD